jgi:hypothetical protein
LDALATNGPNLTFMTFAANGQIEPIVLKNSVLPKKRWKTSPWSASWKFWRGDQPNQCFGEACRSNRPLCSHRVNFSEATDLAEKCGSRIFKFLNTISPKRT